MLGFTLESLMYVRYWVSFGPATFHLKKKEAGVDKDFSNRIRLFLDKLDPVADALNLFIYSLFSDFRC